MKRLLLLLPVLALTACAPAAPAVDYRATPVNLTAQERRQIDRDARRGLLHPSTAVIRNIEALDTTLGPRHIVTSRGVCYEISAQNAFGVYQPFQRMRVNMVNGRLVESRHPYPCTEGMAAIMYR